MASIGSLRARARLFQALGAGVSIIALNAQPAWAQSAGAVQGAPADPITDEQADSGAETVTDADAIVVTGIRQSLANAQTIKRQADTVVDAITAEDIGALPDRSVNEALQRVPGVAISRFAAPNDSQHFSAQGSGVVIRGLNYVRGEFNGRDAFAVGGGREIGFNDIPTEIVGSVEVYKNLTADLIEGGISGNVNINTRKPFDSDKTLLFLSGSMSYGDLEQKGAPSFVGLFSKQFDLGDGGRFGILASGTYTRIRSRADSVFISSMLPRFNDDTNGNGTQDAGEGRTINAGTPYQSTLFDTFPLPTGFDRVYSPVGGGSRTQNFDRRRTGYSGAVQYENADRTFLLTGQFLRAESVEDWLEHTIEPNVYYGDVTTTFPVGGRDFTYDEDGIFTSGVIGKRTGQVFGNNPAGCGTNGDGSLITYCPLTQFAPDGLFTTQSNRHFYSKSITQDQSLNLKWSPSETLHFNFDGQYVKSKLNGYDDILDTATFAQASIDLREKIPTIEFVTPGFETESYFRDPRSIYFRDAFNNRQINDGDEWAFRGDVQYDFPEESFLTAVRVGGRYADRKQTVRTNDYNNWGNLSETWAANGPISYADIEPGDGQLYNFGRFMRGETLTPPSATFVPNEVMGNHERFTELLRRVTDLGGGSYTPLEDRTPSGDATELVRGYFQPNEIYRNSERTWAGYIRLDFGTDDLGNGMGLSGNVGVRYVNTRDRSFGAVTFPQPNTIFTPDTQTPPRYTTLAEYCVFIPTQLQPGQTIPPICTISPEQQAAVLAFANGASFPDTANQKYDHWLPSLNLRLDLTDKFLVRFAASRALSRPNFGSLRNYIGLGASGGNSAGNYGFSGTSGNPFLLPVEAKQFDLTAEWYFARVGSLTGALFYKRLSNIILDNFGFARSFTNNGQSFAVGVNGPANADGSSSIKGAEIAYQQTFDFLPGALRGFGVQATYTYVDAGRIPNSVPANAANDGNRPPQDVAGIYDNLPLAGLSKHNFNVSGFYDLGGFYARVAYSWRSKYLLTNRDCCFPFLPVNALANGQMDASMFYTVNANFKIGVEAQNLLDTTTKTTFILDPSGLEAPRSFFKTDRQYTVSARLTF